MKRKLERCTLMQFLLLLPVLMWTGAAPQAALPVAPQAQASPQASSQAAPEAAPQAAPQAHVALEAPNILFVLVDDVGWADFSYNTPEDSAIPTPHIDHLSAQGVRLQQHYVHPTCTPSRAALMTGQCSLV